MAFLRPQSNFQDPTRLSIFDTPRQLCIFETFHTKMPIGLLNWFRTQPQTLPFKRNDPSYVLKDLHIVGILLFIKQPL